MTLGIMQPYFFPYVGYWQLISAVDTFIIYDNVNYIKGLILDKEQKVLSGVKVNILDSKSRLIKTFTSDGSGMVLSTSPLENGDYYIDCIAKGYDFGRFLLNLNGQKQYLIKIVAK